MVCNHCWEKDSKKANKLFHMGLFKEASVVYLRIYNGYLNLENIENKTSSDELMLHVDRFIITTNNIIECVKAVNSTDKLRELLELTTGAIRSLIERNPDISSADFNRLVLRLKTAENLFELEAECESSVNTHAEYIESTYGMSNTQRA